MPYMFPILITKDLAHSFRSPGFTLQGVDLKIEPGVVQSVSGLSGAGKTVLVRLLSGDLEPSAGTIHIQGKLTTPNELKDGSSKGIRTLAQTLVSPLGLTVADALQMDGIPKKFGFTDNRERMKRAEAALAMTGLSEIDPSEKLQSIPPGKRKLVELAAIVSKPTSLLILDDPTAALTEQESNIVYDQVGRVRSAGGAVLFLTNRSDEALEVADQVAVLREGRFVSNHHPDEVFVHQIAGEMIGRDLSKEPIRRSRATGPEVALRVDSLTVAHTVDGINFKLKRGEVLGLLGLQGAGQSEAVAAIAGAIPHQEGDIYLNARAVPTKIGNRDQALTHGLGFIPMPTFLSSGVANPGALGRGVRGLNSSNPQKGPISMCLQSNPSILLFDCPTQGLNVANRFELYRTILDLADQGIGMVIASTDPGELIRVCDRIAIMANGRIVRTLENREFSIERIESFLRRGR